MTYVFFLGNAPDLAFAELQSVLTRKQISPSPKRQENLAFVQTETPLDSSLFSTLGGAVKVAQVLNTHVTPDNLASEIAQELKKIAASEKKDKITFGISQYGRAKSNNVLPLSKEIKNSLTSLKSRFILPKFPGSELSSVVISKQQVVDFSIVYSQEAVTLAKTIWVQDFEDWGKRDYGRPAAAGHIGMLPPKVARMMVNLAIPVDQSTSVPATLLDPFCGVGTILAEALVLGAKEVVGADLDRNQVKRTEENLSWLQQTYKTSGTYKTFVANAAGISLTFKQKVAAIVTEPDLGPNNLAVVPLETQKKLEQLYLACLADWKQILSPGGTVVIALPSFTTGLTNISNSNDVNLVKTVVDKAKLMGYSVFAGPFEYARPQAKVIRNIFVFTRD